MLQKTRQKVLSLVLALAMVCSLAITTAFAEGTSGTSGWWSDEGNYSTAWYDESKTDFTITSAEELAGLAVLVNGGNTFSGKTINLVPQNGTSIDLSAHYWVPIGGNFTYNGSQPSENPFAGTFNAGKTGTGDIITNYAINGLTIVWNKDGTTPSGDAITTANYGGFGLFGYVDGGTIMNVDVSGSITSNAAAFCTGGIVGYLAGGVYHCNNSVNIDVNNGSPAGTGGIAGVVENNGSGVYYVQYCSNSGSVGGRTRVGGIVGAVYCTSAGGVVIDQCYNTGSMTTHSTANKAYLGGIAGYCRGFITNCYSICTLTSDSGHYMAGLVGLIQGAAPQGKLQNCYTVPTFVKPNTSYDYTAFASVDNSSTLPITDVLWVNSGTVKQEYATGWGLWTQSGAVSGSALQDGSTSITIFSTNSGEVTTTAADVLNGYVFGKDTVNNGGYPILAWQVEGVTAKNFTDSTNKPAPVVEHIYLDGNAASGGDGTEASPYNNFDAALTAANASGADIIVNGTVELDTTLRYTSTVSVVRGSKLEDTDPMFNVTGGTTTLISLKFNGGGVGTIFEVNGGTLQIRSGVTMSNCAVVADIVKGTVDANRGVLTGSQYSFKVESSAATLSLAAASGLTVNGTIYLGAGAVITADDPIPNAITVVSAVTTAGTVIVQGTYDAETDTGYKLTDTDRTKVSVSGKALSLNTTTNQIVILR